MAVFKGSAVAIITPMKAGGEVDYDALADIIEFQVENGTDAIVSCGTTGESATLSHQEHLDVIKFTAEQVKGRVPVIAGTGSNSTKEAIYLSVESEKFKGIDGFLQVSPYYNKATQNGLYQHFKAVADSVKAPVILYNVPSRTGCNITAATTAKLINEIPNVVGVKEASGDMTQVANIAHLTDGKAEIYSGNDDQIVPVMSLGGLGVISVLANCAPKQTHDICARFLEGDIEGSRKMQLDAMDLIGALFCEVNPIPVKKAMELMGKCGGALRLPLTEMEPEHAERLKRSMENYGIL